MRIFLEREARRRDDMVTITQKRLDAMAESGVEAGEALAQMEKFLACTKTEFNQFCLQFFKVTGDDGKRRPLSGRHANRLIVLAEQKGRIPGPMGPQNERQARELARFPKDQQAPAMDAVTAGGPATGSRIAELFKKAYGEDQDPEEVLASERSKNAAMKNQKRRQQEDEGTREQKKVLSFTRKLEKLRVGVVGDVAALIAASRSLGGLVDMDWVEPTLEKMRVSAAELADLAGSCLVAVGDEAVRKAA